MLEAIINFFNFLFKIWSSMPDEQKEPIKKAAEDLFEPLFRQFYQSEKNGEVV